MPKMSNIQRAISMTRSDSWTSDSYKTDGGNEIAKFCLWHCPHKEESCKGDCEEMKQFRAKMKKRGGR